MIVKPFAFVMLLLSPTIASAQSTMPVPRPAPAAVPEANPATLAVPTATVTATVAISGPGVVQGVGYVCKPLGASGSAQCPRQLSVGKPVVFEAMPDMGATFTGWTGACKGQGGRCFLTPTAALSTSATFAAAKAPVLVKIKVVIPIAGGKIINDVFGSLPINCSHMTSGYNGGKCEAMVAVGTQVGFIPKLEPGVTFGGWQSDQPGCSGQTCTFDATNAVTLTAQFIPKP